MDLVKLCIVALFGLFLLNPDVRYAAAVPAPDTKDNGVHSNLLQNINVLGGMEKIFGHIVDLGKKVIEAPLKTVFQQDKSKPASYADTTAKKSPTATTTTTTTTTPAPQDNRDILSRFIDSIQPSSQKLASSQKGNFLDNFLGTLFKKERPVQTTTTTTTTTTLAPQLNNEIGFAALMKNVGKLISSVMSLISPLMAKNQSFELGSVIQHVMEAIGSTKAISDIFLQKDMIGGIGQIGDELKETMGSIKNITDIMSKPGDLLSMLALPENVAKLFKNFMNLKDDLLSPVINFVNGKSNLPALNIPKKFVPLMEPIRDMSNFILKILLPPGNIEEPNDIHSLANHTAGLGMSLLHIESMVEELFPKIKFPIPLVNLPKYVQLLFANDTFNDENIFNVIEEISPNISFTKISADVGNMIKKYLPNMPAVQSVAQLLQNPFLVNLFINTIGSSNLLKFGPLKDSMLQVSGNVGTRLLKMDKNGLIVKSVQLMEDYSTIIENILQLFENIVRQLKPDPKKGYTIGQILTNIPKILMNPENRKMLMEIIYKIKLHLPHNVLFRFIKGIFDNSFIPKSLTYFLTGGPVRELIAFTWQIFLRFINDFISTLKYWLTGGPIRKFIEFIWRILVHKENR
ncbi:uncharacterized protein [Periplaneta americana]|uniref:uncharacterized protein n=1 Tax=Periplaneta americana TaxID=6978 RepID=UPI0037E9C4B9